MQAALKHAMLVVCLTCSLGGARAQDLAPRAYVIGPIHGNAITLATSFSNGEILLNGVVPIPDSRGRTASTSITLYHSFNLLGRYTNVTASLPYGVGNYKGTVFTDQTTVDRSGLESFGFRFSMNLLGGPAMNLAEFRKWGQKSVLGTSVIVITPTGQYDPTKLINLGDNRWSFKPELGYSRRWRKWVLDGYTGVWLFTKNSDYFSRNQYSPDTNTQTQRPIGSIQGHLSYDFPPPRLWASLDGNFWYGGRTSLNGVENPDTREKNSRIGGTLSVPVPRTTHQSLKVSYSDGVYINFGGDFHNVSVAWQYSWLGRPD